MVYKIVNITNYLPKTHVMNGKSISIETGEKNIIVPVGAEVYIETDRLSVDIQKKKIKGYILIYDTSKEMMLREMSKSKKAKEKQVTSKAEEKTKSKPKKSSNKSDSQGNSSEEISSE